MEGLNDNCELKQPYCFRFFRVVYDTAGRQRPLDQIVHIINDEVEKQERIFERIQQGSPGQEKRGGMGDEYGGRHQQPMDVDDQTNGATTHTNTTVIAVAATQLQSRQAPSAQAPSVQVTSAQAQKPIKRQAPAPPVQSPSAPTNLGKSTTAIQVTTGPSAAPSSARPSQHASGSSGHIPPNSHQEPTPNRPSAVSSHQTPARSYGANHVYETIPDHVGVRKGNVKQKLRTAFATPKPTPAPVEEPKKGQKLSAKVKSLFSGKVKKSSESGSQHETMTGSEGTVSTSVTASTSLSDDIQQTMDSIWVQEPPRNPNVARIELSAQRNPTRKPARLANLFQNNPAPSTPKAEPVKAKQVKPDDVQTKSGSVKALPQVSAGSGSSSKTLTPNPSRAHLTNLFQNNPAPSTSKPEPAKAKQVKADDVQTKSGSIKAPPKVSVGSASSSKTLTPNPSRAHLTNLFQNNPAPSTSKTKTSTPSKESKNGSLGARAKTSTGSASSNKTLTPGVSRAHLTNLFQDNPKPSTSKTETTKPQQDQGKNDSLKGRPRVSASSASSSKTLTPVQSQKRPAGGSVRSLDSEKSLSIFPAPLHWHGNTDQEEDVFEDEEPQIENRARESESEAEEEMDGSEPRNPIYNSESEDMDEGKYKSKTKERMWDDNDEYHENILALTMGQNPLYESDGEGKSKSKKKGGKTKIKTFRPGPLQEFQLRAKKHQDSTTSESDTGIPRKRHLLTGSPKPPPPSDRTISWVLQPGRGATNYSSNEYGTESEMESIMVESESDSHRRGGATGVVTEQYEASSENTTGTDSEVQKRRVPMTNLTNKLHPQRRRGRETTEESALSSDFRHRVAFTSESDSTPDTDTIYGIPAKMTHLPLRPKVSLKPNPTRDWVEGSSSYERDTSSDSTGHRSRD